MQTTQDLGEARRWLAEDGGVLLPLGDNTWCVCSFAEAVDMRHGSFDSRYVEASYWAALGVAGYDATRLDIGPSGESYYVMSKEEQRAEGVW